MAAQYGVRIYELVSSNIVSGCKGQHRLIQPYSYALALYSHSLTTTLANANHAALGFSAAAAVTSAVGAAATASVAAAGISDVKTPSRSSYECQPIPMAPVTKREETAREPTVSYLPKWTESM